MIRNNNYLMIKKISIIFLFYIIFYFKDTYKKSIKIVFANKLKNNRNKI